MELDAEAMEDEPKQQRRDQIAYSKKLVHIALYFFNYSSAIASHLFAGDGPKQCIPALMFAFFTVASWALRPADGRLARSTSVGESRPLSWIVSIFLRVDVTFRESIPSHP